MEQLKSLPTRLKLLMTLFWTVSILAAVSLTLVAVLITGGWSGRDQNSAGEVMTAGEHDPLEPAGLYNIPVTAENAVAAPSAEPVVPAPAPEPPKRAPANTAPAATTHVVEEVPPSTEPAAPTATLLDRAIDVDSMLQRGAGEDAAREASSMFDEHQSYQALTDGMIAEGAGEIRSRLLTLRLLQAAGYDDTCRDVARELRRSYAGTREVSDSIRRFKILRPRVISIDPSIRSGRYLTATGTVENPDITSVRNVIVEVVALDAAGNRIGTFKTRVKPKRLAAESEGTFKGAFRGIDPGTIMRTRASVLEFEYEVSAGEQD